MVGKFRGFVWLSSRLVGRGSLLKILIIFYIAEVWGLIHVSVVVERIPRGIWGRGIVSIVAITTPVIGVVTVKVIIIVPIKIAVVVSIETSVTEFVIVVSVIGITVTEVVSVITVRVIVVVVITVIVIVSTVVIIIPVDCLIIIIPGSLIVWVKVSWERPVLVWAVNRRVSDITL